MARPTIERKVDSPPKMIGFKPFGIPMCALEKVVLYFDEFESIKLNDYEGLNQDEAAEKMKISRPTFTRIHQNALKKIAKAFVECSAIEIDMGNVFFEKDWYRCSNCHTLIEGLNNHKQCKNCKKFGDNELIKLGKTEL